MPIFHWSFAIENYFQVTGPDQVICLNSDACYEALFRVPDFQDFSHFKVLEAFDASKDHVVSWLSFMRNFIDPQTLIL